MARSRRKTPIFGHCADSDKPFKVAEHRRERRRVKISMAKCDQPEHPKAFGNPWASCKDGKSYWRDAKAKDMRK